MMRRSLSVLWLLGISSPAWACAVCGGGGQNRQAFIDTMVFMSAMPLAMFGGIAATIWYLVRQASELESTEP